jgi:hypothetical protein
LKFLEIDGTDTIGIFGKRISIFISVFYKNPAEFFKNRK